LGERKSCVRGEYILYICVYVHRYVIRLHTCNFYKYAREDIITYIYTPGHIRRILGDARGNWVWLERLAIIASFTAENVGPFFLFIVVFFFFVFVYVFVFVGVDRLYDCEIARLLFSSLSFFLVSFFSFLLVFSFFPFFV
jgi:hypothetical protein